MCVKIELGWTEPNRHKMHSNFNQPRRQQHHWARAMCAVMAGGDVKGGQVVGATDATASEPLTEGFTPDDVAASFFQNVGIDPQAEFQTNVGRPITLVRDGSPIQKLF